MPVESGNSNGNSHNAIDASFESEPEDRYGWNMYYPHLREQISQEPSLEGKAALKELYERRKEIEAEWYAGKINPEERSDRKFEFAREFSKKHDDLFETDAAFSKAVAIIRDETG